MGYIIFGVFALIIFLKIKSVLNKINTVKDFSQNLMQKKDDLTTQFAEFNNLSPEQKEQYQKELLQKGQDRRQLHQEEKRQRREARNNKPLSFGGRVVFLVIGAIAAFNGYSYITSAVESKQKEELQFSYAQKNMIEVAAPLPQNDGKLIYTAGVLQADEQIDIDGVSMDNALMLKKGIEMYQWKEGVKRRSDSSGRSSKSYSYKKTWSESYNDSSRFKAIGDTHKNPPMEYRSVTKYAKASLNGFNIEAQTIPVLKNIGVANPNIETDFINKGGYFYNKDPNSPQIGDYRIKFYFIPSQKVTVIGKQQNDSIVKYDGFFETKKGIVEPQKMLEEFSSKSSSDYMKMILFGVGFILFGLVFMFPALRPVKNKV